MERRHEKRVAFLDKKKNCYINVIYIVVYNNNEKKKKTCYWGYCWVNISLLLTSFHAGTGSACHP